MWEKEVNKVNARLLQNAAYSAEMWTIQRPLIYIYCRDKVECLGNAKRVRASQTKCLRDFWVLWRDPSSFSWRIEKNNNEFEELISGTILSVTPWKVTVQSEESINELWGNIEWNDTCSWKKWNGTIKSMKYKKKMLNYTLWKF